MANTSSALKAVRSSIKKKEVNEEVKEKIRLARKVLQKAIASKSGKSQISSALTTYYKQVDKAAKKSVNVLSKNKAARLKSSMALKVNGLA